MTLPNLDPTQPATPVDGAIQRRRLAGAARWARVTTLAVSVVGAAGMTGMAVRHTHAAQAPDDTAAVDQAQASMADVPSQSLFAAQGAGADLQAAPPNAVSPTATAAANAAQPTTTRGATQPTATPVKPQPTPTPKKRVRTHSSR